MSQERKTERPVVEEFRGDRTIKRMKCDADCTAYMKAHFKQVKERAAQGEPIIWHQTFEPQEICHAMDLPIFFPVHYSALMAARQMAPYYLDIQNSRGYFRDLCRYCGQALGMVWDKKPEIAPWGGPPPPSAVVISCLDDPIPKIYELFAREYNVPLYIIDNTLATNFPARWWEDPENEPHRVDRTVEEYEGLIRFLETITGRTLSETKLMQVMERSNQEFEYYAKAMDLQAAAVPAPITLTDAWANIIPPQFFRGTEWGLEHARRFYEELEEKIEKGEAACPNERLRLWFAGILWFSPGFFNRFEEKYGAVFTMPGYITNLRMWIRRDLSDPLRALADRYVSYTLPVWIPPTANWFYLREAKRYKIDGAIMLMAESCKAFNTPRVFIRRELEAAGIPTMEIVADMVDARDWDDVKITSHVSSFIETLLP